MDYTESVDTFAWSEVVDITMRYRRDTSDYNTCLSIIRDDEYQVRELGVVPGGLYLDIGCHIGAWAVLVGRLGGRVKAYDPIPENTALACKNAMTNDLDAVEIHQAAVMGGDGDRVRIYYSPMRDEFDLHHRFIGTRIPDRLAGEREYAEARTISLNAILADEPECHVMKMDCEGCEYPILEAASAGTLRKIRYIVGEFHPFGGDRHGLDALLDRCKGVFESVPQGEGAPDPTQLGSFLLRRTK